MSSSSRPVRRRGRATPRYVALAESIIADIRGGKFPVGSRLPTENELCKTFGMSRHTVRDALRILREQGLVERRPGAGTTVIADEPMRHYEPAMTSIAELLQYAKLTLQEIISVEPAQPEFASETLKKAVTDQSWVRVALVRYPPNDDIPLLYNEVYLPEAFAAATKGLELGVREPFRKPFRKIIESRFQAHAVTATQTISAIAIPADIAAYLSADPGSPGLELMLHYVDANDRLIEISRSIFAADRYSYSMKIRLNED